VRTVSSSGTIGGYTVVLVSFEQVSAAMQASLSVGAFAAFVLGASAALLL